MSTKYASWTVEKKVCSKCGLCQKVQGACRWCNFHYDIRADITSRLDGNSEKYAGGWNVTARRRWRRGSNNGTSFGWFRIVLFLAYISHDRGIRTGYLPTWRYRMVVNNEVQKCGTKQSWRNLRNHRSIQLEEPSTITKTYEDSGWDDLDSNRPYSDYR